MVCYFFKHDSSLLLKRITRFMLYLFFCQVNSDIEEKVQPFWIPMCISWTLVHDDLLEKILNSEKFTLSLFYLNLSSTTLINNYVIQSIL